MQRTLAIAHVALRGEMRRPPSLPRGPPVALHDDSYIKSIGHDQISSYARMCHDTIRDTWSVHDPCDTNLVHIYETFESYLKILHYLY